MIPRNLFPQYKKANTCALVGFAPTSRHLAPYNDPGVDLWFLNEAMKYDWMKQERPAGWFQMHPKWDFMRLNNRNDPGHWRWLQQEHDFPIFMQAAFPDVPASVRYPIDAAIDAFGMYFTSSFSYMLALAILMGYERIECYGFEMQASSEYGYQKPAAEYLLGFAKGLGVDVYLPPKCALLRGNLYAYEDLRAADRTFFSFREVMLKKNLEAQTAQAQRLTGRVEELEDLLKSPEIRETDGLAKVLAGRYVTRKDEQINAAMQVSVAEGALSEIKSMIRWHDEQNIPDDRVEKEQAHE